MTDEQRYCSFLLDTLTFGVTAVDVQEIIRYQPMTRVPLADAVVSGLINLRGQIVTAIDLRRCLGLPPRGGADPTNVVVHTPDGVLSLLVDRIGDVIEVPDGAIHPPPDTMAREVKGLIRGAYQLPDRLLLVLNTSRLNFAGARDVAA